MTNNKSTSFLSPFLFLGVSVFCASSAYAAKSIDLSKQPVSILHAFAATPAAAVNAVKMEEVSRSVDFNQTLHVRVQETYQGHPVWGGDAVVHVPGGARTAKSFTAVASAAKQNNGSMNGQIYQELQADLMGVQASSFDSAQADKALAHAIKLYQEKERSQFSTKHEKATLMVYVDKDKKAHWAYQVSFYALPTKAGDVAAKPLYILDARTFAVYQQWNDIKTLDHVQGGGFGGNKKAGKYFYNGVKGNLPSLQIQRDPISQTCFMQNDEVRIRRSWTDEIMSFNCPSVSKEQGGIYWNAAFGSINGGYSPSNDALYAGKVIKDLYQDWYNIPVLKKPDGTPLMLTMQVHVAYMDNAFWIDEEQVMIFGDGQYYFYPLTSLDVAAHEVSHGFTSQHSNLIYTEESGGMNEAFSDMAAVAASVYVSGKPDWKIGANVYKLTDKEALRFIDEPTKDCVGLKDPKPGLECSVDNAKDYTPGKDPQGKELNNVHFTSGVYNKAFYLLANTKNWDVKKAFDVMVQANISYWTPNSTFDQGACGVKLAAQDYGYNTQDVVDAFKKVGVNATC